MAVKMGLEVRDEDGNQTLLSNYIEHVESGVEKKIKQEGKGNHELKNVEWDMKEVGTVKGKVQLDNGKKIDHGVPSHGC